MRSGSRVASFRQSLPILSAGSKILDLSESMELRTSKKSLPENLTSLKDNKQMHLSSHHADPYDIHCDSGLQDAKQLQAQVKKVSESHVEGSCHGREEDKSTVKDCAQKDQASGDCWEENDKKRDYPWQALESRVLQVQLLTVFITWAGLRFLQSILDAGTQYSLVSRDTIWVGVRMVLKSLVAMTWAVVFGVFYGMIWSQKNSDGRWSYEANQRIFTFLKAAFVFLIPELLAGILIIV